MEGRRGVATVLCSRSNPANPAEALSWGDGKGSIAGKLAQEFELPDSIRFAAGGNFCGNRRMNQP